MPLSWRIEKFIYAIWHALIVVSYLWFIDTSYCFKLKKWSTNMFGDFVSNWLGYIFFFYVAWQLIIFFLHMSNALSGNFYLYFNYGSIKNFLRTVTIIKNGIEVEGPTPYHNINRVMQFREAKMGAVSQSDAAEIMAKTAFLDAAASGMYQGHNAKRAMSNLNAKLGAMGQRDGLEYLMNR